MHSKSLTEMNVSVLVINRLLNLPVRKTSAFWVIAIIYLTDINMVVGWNCRLRYLRLPQTHSHTHPLFCVLPRNLKEVLKNYWSRVIRFTWWSNQGRRQTLVKHGKKPVEDCPSLLALSAEWSKAYIRMFLVPTIPQMEIPLLQASLIKNSGNINIIKGFKTYH